MLRKALIAALAGAVAIALAIGGSKEPLEVAEANLAPCLHEGKGGAEASLGRRATQRAGPLAVPRAPLREMRRGANGQLHTNMEVLVRGHHYVVLSVPLALRNRVFLYYGQVLDNRGQEPRSPFAAPGYAETEFQPCRDLAETVWSGGVRVIGEGPVRLLVTVEGRSVSIPLALGRPRSGAPAT